MTRTAQIVADLTARIAAGTLAPGVRLPSLRRAAEEYGVSKNTVVAAYDRLVAKGAILSRPGSGFTVAEAPPAGRSAAPPRHVVEAVDMISLLRAQLDQTYDLRVGDGRPPESWADTLPAHAPGAGTRIGEPSGYGPPRGDDDLRRLIVARLGTRGITVDPDRIVTTLGGNHALDMIIRRYLVPGDTVLVDDPGYYPLFSKLKLSRVSYFGVRRTPTGPDPDDLRAKARAHRPKMFFTQSTAQNPTGSSMDLPTAHAVLQIAAGEGFTVVDDDPFIDLPGVTGHRLAELDQCRNVILVGTFSKTLSAAYRVGYVAAPPQVAGELTELKMVTVVNGARLSEIAIARLIEKGRYQRYLNRISRHLSQASRNVAAAFDRIGVTPRFPLGNGFYTYLTLPRHLDDLDVAREAARARIFIAPGTFFRVAPEVGEPGMRINLTRADDSRFFRFLARIYGDAGG